MSTVPTDQSLPASSITTLAASSGTVNASSLAVSSSFVSSFVPSSSQSVQRPVATQSPAPSSATPALATPSSASRSSALTSVPVSDSLSTHPQKADTASHTAPTLPTSEATQAATSEHSSSAVTSMAGSSTAAPPKSSSPPTSTAKAPTVPDVPSSHSSVPPPSPSSAPAATSHASSNTHPPSAPSSSRPSPPASGPGKAISPGPSSANPTHLQSASVAPVSTHPVPLVSSAHVVGGSPALSSVSAPGTTRSSTASLVSSAHSSVTTPDDSATRLQPSDSVTPTRAVSSSVANLTEQSVFAQASTHASIATSTITDHPETTLTSPVLLSVTDSRGRATLSEPPVITSVGVSTSDGTLVSVTHVIANPTGVWGLAASNTAVNGLFAKPGAVAGVFLVVGAIIAALLVGGCCLYRRGKRRERIRHSISRPLPAPDNPFENPRESPSPTQMRYAAHTSQRNLVGAGLGVAIGSPHDLDDTRSSSHGGDHYAKPVTNASTEGLGLAGIGAGMVSLGRPPYNGPFNNLQNRRPAPQRKPSAPVPVFIPVAQEQFQVSAVVAPTRARRSGSASSSPSIYPSSLPPVQTDNANHGHDESELPPLPPPKPAAPTLPPRNPLRMSRSKLLIRTELTSQDSEMLGMPLTPPATSTSSSDSSHGPFNGRSVSAVNPFLDELQGLEMPSMPPQMQTRDTFYTRRNMLGRRPSSTVEWKQ